MSSKKLQQASSKAHDPSAPQKPDHIPLVCHICPKSSRFSDLSHLLTHISSKGHLQKQFQLQLARDVDEEAELAITRYEEWRKQNGVDALLRARKVAKEQRDIEQQRNTQIPSSSARGSPAELRVMNRNGRGARRGRGTSKRGAQFYDDEQDAPPETVNLKYEEELDGYYQDKHDNYSTNYYASFGWHSGSPYLNNPSQYTNYPGNHFYGYVEDEDDSSHHEASELYSPFHQDASPDAIEGDTGAIILKGVVYPGMAGFDSATEKDRRMRNQKKDPAVILKLQENSQLVSREEMVLDAADLSYQRTRDVYDEPSIDGSEDENDDNVDEPRIKRRGKAKSAYASARRRSNTRTRQQPQLAERSRAVRSSTRKARDLSYSSVTQPNVLSRRTTRSSSSRQEQLPLHNHGVHPTIDSHHDYKDELDNSEGFRTHIDTTVVGSLGRQHHERLPGLALRPGNPNATFASPVPGFKKSPPRYSGREDNHLLIRSPSSFGPYPHQPGGSIGSGNFNPLYTQPQPRDGFGYRNYSAYGDESTSSTGSGFNPINAGSTYDRSQVPSGTTDNQYQRNQPGRGDNYQL
ncbi:hypothetical protein F4777DRAFT_593949 [Nemania sp. FL0916]|nr:hypothetical protein F4777DRAFT_593949 [Nemania sp. FL0916]